MSAPMLFDVTCAWCGDVTGHKPVEHDSSMCGACLDRLYPVDESDEEEPA